MPWLPGMTRPEDVPADDRSAAGIPLNVKIRKAGITDGSVVFSDPENTVSAAAINMEVSDADLLQQTATVFINISGISLSNAETAIDISTFTASGALKENDLADIAIALDSDLGVISAAGSVEGIFTTFEK